MAGLSPRERRMQEAVSLEPIDPSDYVPETEEEKQARHERNLFEWNEAYKLAKSPRQRDVLLAELERGRGIDFPGTAQRPTGFVPPSLEPSDPPVVQGFEPPQVPGSRFSEDVQEWADRGEPASPQRDLTGGSGVSRVPPIGFEETPSGAVTGLRFPRVGGDEPERAPAGPAARIAAETMGAALGGTIGAAGGALTRSPTLSGVGMRAGEAGGAFLGSLFAEAFDPTEAPLQTAAESAAFTAVTGAVASGTAAVFRRMIGQPTEAGKTILKIMEKEGKVPPPGAVLPETSIAQSIQSIGSAEAFWGRSVKEHVLDTGLAITKNVKHYVTDFYRYKKGADKAFKQWDEVTARLGYSHPAWVKPEVFDALEIAVKEWERLGLMSKVDSSLLKSIQHAQAQRALAAETGQQIDRISLSLTEAEAARTFLYNRARAMAGSTPAEKGAVAGQDFARAYRSMAEDVGNAIDDAITSGVKNGKISTAERGLITGGRQLWKQWKQGEAILEELAVPLKAAGRREGPLKAQRIETAINNIEQMEAKFGRPVISSTQKAHLAGLMRALRAVEESGKSSAFTLAVRTGQLASLTINVPRAKGFGDVVSGVLMTLSPAAFTFLTTNPKAASLLIRGLRLDPGSATAARVGRELLTLMAREGFAPPERVGEPVVEE